MGSMRPPRQRLSWSNDHTQREYTGRYQVRIAPAVLLSIRREVTVMRHRRGPRVETGGILLGQIDRASRVVWVSAADGPPPGSVAYAEGLKLDLTESRQWAGDRRRLSRGLISYIGAWHSHPEHPALPSQQDHAAMTEMARDGIPVLLMILGVGRGLRPGKPDGFLASGRLGPTRRAAVRLREDVVQ
jgi:proteasome lid subunit RPN8/RPN11